MITSPARRSSASSSRPPFPPEAPLRLDSRGFLACPTPAHRLPWDGRPEPINGRCLRRMLRAVVGRTPLQRIYRYLAHRRPSWHLKRKFRVCRHAPDAFTAMTTPIEALLVAFEIHAPGRIRDVLQAGFDVTQPVNGQQSKNINMRTTQQGKPNRNEHQILLH